MLPWKSAQNEVHRGAVNQNESALFLGFASMNESKPPLVQGQKVWCPRCNEYVKIVRIASAAMIIDVDRRTIYK